MPQIHVKGFTYDKVVKRATEITAKVIATAAKPVVIANTASASKQLAKCIKQESTGKNSERIFIQEKNLFYPNMVPGNKSKSRFISSNYLASILDEGTPAHVIVPVSSGVKKLHFMAGGMGVGMHVFTTKVNHPGTKAQEFWGNKPNVITAINSAINERLTRAA